MSYWQTGYDNFENLRKKLYFNGKFNFKITFAPIEGNKLIRKKNSQDFL